MHSTPASRRLGVALLCSVLLHAAWLLPDLLAPTSGPGISIEVQPALILTTRLPAAPRPPAVEALRDRAAPATPEPADPRHFYGTEQLTRAPRPLKAVDLDIPEASLLIAPGTLTLTLWIDDKGQVTAYEVDAPGLPEEYSTAVAEAFSAVRFAPGEILGRKVGSILKLEIRNAAATGQPP